MMAEQADTANPAGNYYNDIVAELQNKGQGVDPDHIDNSLFSCRGSGSITYQEFCSGGCQDGGSGETDSC
jgi:hypothetical protein